MVELCAEIKSVEELLGRPLAAGSAGGVRWGKLKDCAMTRSKRSSSTPLKSTPKDATLWVDSGPGGQARHQPNHRGEICRTYGLNPRRTDSFKVSPHLHLVETIRATWSACT